MRREASREPHGWEQRPGRSGKVLRGKGMLILETGVNWEFSGSAGVGEI